MRKDGHPEPKGPRMNQVSFTCRLTKDPEVRHVGTANSHASVVTLRVAIDDRQRSKERPGLFLDIEAWGPLAERPAASTSARAR